MKKRTFDDLRLSFTKNQALTSKETHSGLRNVLQRLEKETGQGLV
jgi:hypothetical protein